MGTRIRRRRLPHIDIDDGTYFVTSCLANSIPALGLRDLDEYARTLEARRPKEMCDRDWRIRCWKLVFAKADEWLDNEPAARHLEDHRLAAKVVGSMYHFAGIRYNLLAFVVMPSHFHWVFHPRASWTRTLPSGPNEPTPREIIMHSLKRFSAHECNQLLGTQGQFWQDESYDHVVRDEDELCRIIEYIEANPVKAKLVEESVQWVFSSAHDRVKRKLAAGAPLTRSA